MNNLPELKNPFINAKIIGANIDPQVYHQQDGVRGQKDYVMSRSELCTFAECPSKWIEGATSKDTDATEWGTLMDTMLAGKEAVEKHYIVRPSAYTNEKKETKDWNWNANACKAWREENAKGRKILAPEEWQEAQQAFERLMADKEIADLLACSEISVMVVAEYHDKATGLIIPVKILIDILPARESRFGNCIDDSKTARSAVPRDWVRAVYEHDYHTQGALYIDVYNAATGEMRDTFSHVVQENTFPWQPARRFLSQEYLQLGRLAYLDALKRYCQCLAENRWPSWDDDGEYNGWTIVEPEPWMIGKEAA
jgi:hypothetical protein